MTGTLYLEVPNDLTRGMLEQRIRVPLLNAIGSLDEAAGVSNFAIVVNPEIAQDAFAQHPEPAAEQPYIETPTITAPTDNPGLPASPSRGDSRLNPKYGFDTFVIGGSNGSPMPRQSPSPRRRPRHTTLSSSTATRASARPTCCTPSATTPSASTPASACGT